METAWSLVPFRIAIPQAMVDDLRSRLEHTRWPDELPDARWEYGVPLAYLRDLADYWRDGYDWRAWEERLNRFSQLTTEIDGQTVHFLHVRSPEPDAFPLILTHGWPGSIVEFLEVIAPLTNPVAHSGNPADAFHLVIPSIPGFGFSGPTRDRGWDVRRVALAWAELMFRLGYERYGAQGGDWGSAISRDLGLVDAGHVVGVHVNYLRINPNGDLSGLTDRDHDRGAKLERYLAEQPGYIRIQATRPQTLSYGLTDSPVGQLAWIAEKFREWSDPASEIDRDRLLTDVSIYWFTGTSGSSARLYFESARGRGVPNPLPVPLGVAVFPHDILLPVRAFAERQYTITRWSEFDRGGHFAAMEVPDLLVDDVRAFFRQFR